MNMKICYDNRDEKRQGTHRPLGDDRFEEARTHRIRPIAVKSILFASFFLACFAIPFLSRAATLYEISDGSVKGLYYLNSDSTFLNDSSGNGNTLTNTGTVTSTAGPIAGLGAALANGTDYLHTTGNILSNATNTSIAFWVNVTSTSQHGYMLCNGTCDSTNGWGFAQGNTDSGNSGSNLIVRDTAVGPHVIQSLSRATWYFVVVTISPTSVFNVYVNGSNVKTFTQSFPLATTPFAIFADGAGDRIFPTGNAIAEPMITNNVLTQAQITAMYNGGSGVEVCTTAGCASTGGSPITGATVGGNVMLQVKGGELFVQ